MLQSAVTRPVILISFLFPQSLDTPAGLSVTVALSGPGARAQQAVIDLGAITQLAQQVGVAKQQYDTLQSQLGTLRNTYSQVASQYSMLTRLANVNQLAPELAQQLRSMPGSGNMGQFFVGSGSIGSLGGGVSGLAQQFLNRNRVYLPQATDPNAIALNERAQQLAGIQAMAMTNVQSLDARLDGLADLKTSLDSADDLQKVASIQARMQAESNIVQTQQAQAQNLLVMAQMQERAEQQADDQRARQSADGLFNATRPMSQSQGAQGGTPSAALSVPTFAASSP
jgi:flagellar biosynthesis chaperone FliJ